MRIKPSIGLVVGPVNEIHWGQVLTSPQAYGIIEIADTSCKAQEHGVRLLSEVSRLLQTSITSLKELEEICNTVHTSIIRTLILLVPVGKILYIVVRGVGSVYVKRGSELASLMHADGGISGAVQEGDTILLASEGFSSVLTREELTGLFDHLKPHNIAEKLTLILHEKTGGEGSSALVFGVSEFVDIDLSQVAAASRPSVSQVSPVLDVPKKEFFFYKENIKHIFDIEKIRVSVVNLRARPKAFKALIAICCILFFGVSVMLGIQKQKSVKKNQHIATILVDAQHALEEGVALLDLNPAKGRERLEEAKTLLLPLQETVSMRTIEGRNAKELYQKVTDNLTQALKVTRVVPSLFFDVSLLKNNSLISYIARDASSLVLSDSTTNTLYKMDVSSKNTHIIGGGEQFKGSTALGSHGSKTYVYTQAGIMELVDKSEKKPSLIIKKDDEWGMIASLVSFGGNIYLQDTIKSRIWKYVATETGFSERREYLNPDTLPDLTRTSAMAIDGSIWMGTSEGKIVRFTQGKENTYIPKGLDVAFSGMSIVYTSDDTKYIYVLDSGHNRIVVLDKEGMYISQYQLDGVLPKQFVVLEEEKLILLLIDGKLYSIDLR